MPLPRITVAYGFLLIVLGVAGYYGTGQASVTALIPAFFGLPILALGVFAGKKAPGRAALLSAAVLALVGLAGAARGMPDFVTVLTGGEVERPPAAIAQGLMVAFSAIYLVVGWRKGFRG